MSENLTKIFCGKIPTKFLMLYIRFKGYNKNDLNLVKFNSSYKICDTRIRNNAINAHEEFLSLKIDIEDYFNVNILTASSKRRSNEFTLQREKTFDQEGAGYISHGCSIQRMNRLVRSREPPARQCPHPSNHGNAAG